jgi:CRP-like cAMP-binding protein
MSISYRKLFPSLDYLGDASGYVDEILEIIDKLPLFESLKADEISTLCGYMHCFAAPRKTVLLKEGDQGDFLLLVLTGKVRIEKQTEGGEYVYATVGPGANLGEMSMLDGEPRFATCIATEPTDFAVLSRVDLNEILVMHPRLGNKFLLVLLQVMTHRLRAANISLLPHLEATAL